MKLNVKLVSWTNKPIETMMWAFMNMHHHVPDSVDKFIEQQKQKWGDEWEQIKKDFIKLMSINPHNSVLEFVNTVWYIEGGSRAFQQQLTRTREAAYSIQSLRIVPVQNFANDKLYHVPDRIKENPEAKATYEKIMKQIQKGYKELLNFEDIKTEDARGVLPLNIQSPITMSINLRRLQHMLEMRLCHLTQGEYRKVGALMVNEIISKLGEEFRGFFKPPCVNLGYCPMPIHCGKMPYKQKKEMLEVNVYRWLKG